MSIVGEFFFSIRYITRVTISLLLILIITTEPAYAYLDPGTGAMIIQLLLGGIAGALMVGKLYLHKIKSYFAHLLGYQPQDKDGTEKD